MNSQQELLEAINTISQNRDRSFDTPATVLRVEGDTVWVHIDGGADETPCLKTINCAEGETVQVRISNGNAFLVGNASAPPTDDKTANVAHFVAEQADVKATSAEEKAVEAIRSVEAIEQTVEGKVDSGDSNITDISSTMYQNANGVNIFNDTLAVGDSYAHIDGDSFDIKKCTTAGTINDANDPILSSFGRSETLIRSTYGSGSFQGENFVKIKASGVTIGQKQNYDESGLEISGIRIKTYDDYNFNPFIVDGDYGNGTITLNDRYDSNHETKIYSGQAHILKNKTTDEGVYINETDALMLCQSYDSVSDDYLIVKIRDGNIWMDGDVYSRLGGYKKTPTILTSTTISASTTSYTFTDDAITADSVIDIYDTIFGFSPSNISASAGSCTVTFPAQSSSHTIKLFVY